MNSLQFRWMYLTCCVLLAACSDSVQHLTKTSANPQPDNSLFQILKDSTFIHRSGLFSYCALTDFYTDRHHKFAWLKEGTYTPQGDSLLAVLKRVQYYGLIPDDYHLDVIDSLSKKEDVHSLALLDIRMTDGFMKMAFHVRYGRVQKDVYTKTTPSADMDAELISFLKQATRRNVTKSIESWEPSYSTYKILKQEMGRKLDSLALTVDSDSRSRLENQIGDLALNMEQWRWESSTTGRYILVNIPSFRMEVIDHDSVVFESNVVVGAMNSPTPLLDASIRNFVIYPTWTVPRNIATRELLPKIKRDSAYLASNQYRVLDMEGNVIPANEINWENYNYHNFPYMLQQAEGDHNALGLVKFTFPNEHNVYLHDTNARRFFRFNRRAYSHGCVRVEKALELAKFLVSEENPYCSPNDLEGFFRKAASKQVTINPVDLRIRYFTCEAKKDGTVSFHEDIYGLNKNLKEAIYCRK